MRMTMLIAEAAPEPLINRLDPSLRMLVLLALTGIVLLGVIVIGLAAWGGWLMRRESRKRVKPIDRGQSDWDRKQPLDPPVPPLDALP